MRTLLRIVGAKNNARVNLKIYEPEGSRGPRAPRMGGSMGSNPNAPSSADLNDIKL